MSPGKKRGIGDWFSLPFGNKDSQKPYKKILDNIQDPSTVDLGEIGLDEKKLQELVSQGKLSPEQLQKVVQIANRPEMKGHFPELLDYKKAPIENMPDRNKLNEVVQPLDQKEMREMADLFVQNVQNGHHMVFIGRHNIGAGVRLSEHNQDVLPSTGIMQSIGFGEGAYVCDGLVAGYRTAKKKLDPKTYSSLMNRQTAHEHKQAGFYRMMSGAGDSSMLRDARYEKNRLAMTTAIRDMYIPQKDDKKLTEGQVQIDSKGNLHQVSSSEVRAFKTVQVGISNDRDMLLGGSADRRCSYFDALIIIGGSNICNKHLNKPGKQGYLGYLRAIHTNPGFFLEALKKAVPDVFALDNGNNYYPDSEPEENLKMDVDFGDLGFKRENVNFKKID